MAEAASAADARETQIIKVLNGAENPLDSDRKVWWHNQELYMETDGDATSVVQDTDGVVKWGTVFWSHWSSKLAHWAYIKGQN